MSKGRYSYAKGAVAKIASEYPTDANLRSIAVNLREWQRPYFFRLSATMVNGGRYSHEHSVRIEVEADRRVVDDETEKGIAEQLREFMRWIYRSLEAEYTYRLSDPAVDETIIANEYEFTEDGRRAC